MKEKLVVIENLSQNKDYFKDLFDNSESLIFANGSIDNIKNTIRCTKPDIIFIENNLSKKFELKEIQNCRSNKKLKTPIIVYTNETSFSGALQTSASDFIKLPVEKEELNFRIKNAIYHNQILKEVELQRQKLERSFKKNKKKTLEIFGKHVDLKKAKKEIEQQREILEGQQKILEKAFEKNKRKTIDLFGKHVDLKKAKKEIDKQKKEIELFNKEITDSIKYASIIQSSALPRDEDIDEILDEYFVLYIPKHIVSGDFYWVGEKNNKTFVIAADCTGHGVPGAFMSMMGISLLNEIIHESGEKTAGEILNILRAKVVKMLKDSDTIDTGHDGMDIALCIIDKENKKIQYSGAYNPLYLVRNFELHEYKANRMPIGFSLRLDKPFKQIDIDYEPGDCIYMFSDGYSDQFGGDEGMKLRSKVFKDILAGINALPMEEQKVELIELHETWKGQFEQVDDILVVGVRL
ncbi:SpoIIE family protein phosphatase [Bacteroidota bacterium]